MQLPLRHVRGADAGACGATVLNSGAPFGSFIYGRRYCPRRNATTLGSDRALALAHRVLACMHDAIVRGDRRNLSSISIQDYPNKYFTQVRIYSCIIVHKILHIKANYQ
jgi:hypothetical protein